MVEYTLVVATFDEARDQVKLAAVKYLHWYARLIVDIGRHFGYLLHNLHAVDDLTKDDVLAV